MTGSAKPPVKAPVQVPGKKPAAAKPVPGKAPAKAAAPAVAPKKYAWVTIRDPKTKALTRVRMEQSKANALATRRKAARTAAATAAQVADTSNMIPSAYRGLVDPAGVDRAVSSTIEAATVPYTGARTQVEATYEDAARRAASIAAQTQATLGSAYRNAINGGGVMQAQAAQASAALNGANNAAAAELARLSAGSANPQLASMYATTVGQQSTANNQASTANVFGSGLEAGLQADFLQRAAGIGQMQQQAWSNDQAARLSETLGQIATQIAGVQAQRPDLVRRYAGEEAEFALQDRTAAQAFGQQQAENQLAAYNAETGRYEAKTGAANDAASVAQRAEAARIAAAAKIAAAQESAAAKNAPKIGQFGVDKKFDKDIGAVLNAMRNVESNLGKPINPTKENPDGDGKFTWKHGGGWQDAYVALKDRGVPATNAAFLASKWFASQIASSTPQNVRKTLTEFGVPPVAQKRIITNTFGAKGWADAQPAPPRTGDTYPIGQALKLNAKTYKITAREPAGKGRFTWTISGNGQTFKVTSTPALLLAGAMDKVP